MQFFTWCRRLPERDPTSILIDYQTESQKNAYQDLAKYNVSKKNLAVSIIVPFKDRWDLTQKCLEGVLSQDFDGHKINLILVDNGSSEPATHEGLQALRKNELPDDLRINLIRDDGPFNFSRLINQGFERGGARESEVLILLNNDIEFVSSDTIWELSQFIGTVPKVGAVGTTLVYPNERIQHLFVAPGVVAMGAHPFSGLKWKKDLAWLASPRPVAAVTGACLAVSTTDFISVGGLDERLPSSGQDVDFCLKLQKIGKTNWALSQEKLIHHESASRKCELSLNDCTYLYDKWEDFLTSNPSYHKIFSRWSERPVYSLGEGDFPWKLYCRQI